MKIALKSRGLSAFRMAALVAFAGFMVAPSVVGAQTTMPAAPAAPEVATSVTAPTPSQPVDPSLATATSAVTPAPDKDGKNSKSLGSAEDKVKDSVKDIAKRLGNTDTVTLDDLNSARQAVAKIEALIDIEKHLNELDKLRSEREGGSHSSMMGAIPASALNPYGAGQMPPPLPIPVSAFPASAINPMASFSSIDVSRIIGSNGHFSAVVKTGDGQSKTVSVGDRVDGATVTAITASGVELSRGKTTHVVRVKNVQSVFSDIP